MKLKKILFLIIGSLLVTILLLSCSSNPASNVQSNSIATNSVQSTQSTSNDESSDEPSAELPEELNAIDTQMMANLVDKELAYIPSESVSDYMNFYRGYITKIIPLNEKNGYFVVEQTEGGVDYGTPVYAGYGSFVGFAGKVDFKIGDYVEILYSADSAGRPELHHGSNFPIQKMSMLFEEEKISSGEVFHDVATIKEATHPDKYHFSLELSDGSSMTLDAEGYMILENVWPSDEEQKPETGLAAGDKIEFWGYYSENNSFTVLKIVKI